MVLAMHNRSSMMVGMNKLGINKRCQVASALVEGCSIRSTVRMTGVAKNAVTKLLVDLGQMCMPMPSPSTSYTTTSPEYTRRCGQPLARKPA